MSPTVYMIDELYVAHSLHNWCLLEVCHSVALCVKNWSWSLPNLEWEQYCWNIVLCQQILDTIHVTATAYFSKTVHWCEYQDWTNYARGTGSSLTRTAGVLHVREQLQFLCYCSSAGRAFLNQVKVGQLSIFWFSSFSLTFLPQVTKIHSRMSKL